MDVLIGQSDAILTIEFNRPQKKNALTAAMYAVMADALEQAGRDESVKAILFSGKPEVFSAGNDLEEFLQAPPQGDSPPVHRFMTALHTMEKPVVAAVSGKAIGIGATMLLHCDLVYASDDAVLAMPFTQLGLCPEFASSLLLPRLAGYQRAAEKLMLGEPFAAKEALDMGLVNRVVPAQDLMELALGQAKKLCALSPASLRATKRLLKSGLQEKVEERIMDEMRIFGELLRSPEARRVFTAFLEKRK